MAEEPPINKSEEEKPQPEKPTTPETGAAPAAKPAVPAVATKPAIKRPAVAPKLQSRRHFIFTWLGLAWTAFAVATGAAVSTLGRFLFPNVLFEPEMSFKAGKPDEYEVGMVDLRWVEKYGVWLVRSAEGMYALSTVCTHLGCKPSWLPSEEKFKCPCHGSGFYKSGVNFEGPAPRPLERFKIELSNDGQVVVDKSKKFQQEKGEWNSPESFLTV